jgi:hypothetical protein
MTDANANANETSVEISEEGVRHICKKCRYYKRPKCLLKDAYTAREDFCKEWLSREDNPEDINE